jgi:adenine-specific DNA methylase
MMDKYPKRLIEVDLPIKRISAHARREKSIRHGHISTLHIWWARRPLAACRAVVCASLWPDPADDICPPRFVETAKRLMQYWGNNFLGKCSADSYPRFNKIIRMPECLDDHEELRKTLLDFIADFANWDNSTDAGYLSVARTLTVAAHDALEGLNVFDLSESISTESLNDAIKDAPRPLLVDPFAGGGAIPLEGLRCGADAFASDLNPVAVLLNKVVLEYIPKHGYRLGDEIKKWGSRLQERVKKELLEFYPEDKEGGQPIAYLWARTIRCEGPGCGAKIPLIRSFWLSKKQRICLEIKPNPSRKFIEFLIKTNVSEKEVNEGTVKRGSAICPCCNYTVSRKQVQAQVRERKTEPTLLAVVVKSKGVGKYYRLPTEKDFKALESAKDRLRRSEFKEWIPTESLPYLRSIFNVNVYGIDKWCLLFDARQTLSLVTLCRAVESISQTISKHDSDIAEAVSVCLAISVDRLADFNSNIARWANHRETSAATFGRQALGMVWDYCETVPTSDSTGSLSGSIEWVQRVCQSLSEAEMNQGDVLSASAARHPLPDDSASLLLTDPPYYDAIPYANLSDFFYVWLKRSLKHVLPEMFLDEETPKDEEAVQLAERNIIYSYKTKDYFENLMARSFENARRYVQSNGLGVIVFAHKTTSAWESLLEATINAGWRITASWPIDTEMGSRLRAKDSAALASSVHLVCRPREDTDGNVIEQIGDWRDVLSELPGRISAWLPRLASEGVVGADAIFACLGPALEIFSRYSSVEKASGEVVPLREYLEHVWAEVARQALNMIFEDADASGFEEDARLTAMWLWTLRTDANGNGTEDEKAISLPGYTLEYDAARKIAQGLGCHLEHLTYLVEVKGSKAMLLSAESRARFLFGKQEVGMTSNRGKKKDSAIQLDLFSLTGSVDEEETGVRQAELERPPAGKTILDQLHQAMLLFTAGRGAALKRFLVDDGIGSNPQFWTLAQALSALYPPHTNEKRWVDGVLARKKGLGF